jgi:hypothetical protein
LAAAGFERVEIRMVATLHRYAGDRALIGAALRVVERALPSRARSTIVARYRAV